MGKHLVILLILKCVTHTTSESEHQNELHRNFHETPVHLTIPGQVREQFSNPPRKHEQVQFHTENRLRQEKQSPNVTGTPEPGKNQQSSILNPRLLIEMRVRPIQNQSLTFIRISNTGEQDEFVRMSVFDSSGHLMHIIPSQFPLGRGSSAEIPLPPMIPQKVDRRSSAYAERSAPKIDHLEDSKSTSPPALLTSPSNNMITVLARGKRNTVKRSFVFGDPYDVNYNNNNYNIEEPFCFEKDVTGTCRYRDDPYDCFRWHWTAYATILNYNGGKKISSIPEGLFLDPGEHGRVRVYLKLSCCTPIVQFISTDIYHNIGVNSCVVDVRELQALHPGEIAGIVVGVVALILIIIVVIILCLRKRRKETINNVGIPRISRSRTPRKDNVILTSRP